MKVFVPVKRVVDYNVKVRVKGDGTGVDIANVNSARQIVISGHTHGGQIWLPWVTRNRVLPGMSRYGWYEGRYATPAGDLFVTAGTGMIGLPARLGVVPRVDVITLAP